VAAAQFPGPGIKHFEILEMVGAWPGFPIHRALIARWPKCPMLTCPRQWQAMRLARSDLSAWAEPKHSDMSSNSSSGACSRRPTPSATMPIQWSGGAIARAANATAAW
jgi:hypothetical protein